ncbi:hypothetical protein NPX13_g106 [Xylaria arbuscula]|uniref:Uncharacterized protein n=1 Tax=Xylaria arbuscula TaxID=114810 RepID=A0A9W8TRC6_9PEZI|nr:hypothetical protein NPX13_g106 [Xylaria arbuscula]
MNDDQDRRRDYDFDRACKDIIVRLLSTYKQDAWEQWLASFQERLRNQIQAANLVGCPSPLAVQRNICESIWEESFPDDPLPWSFKHNRPKMGHEMKLETMEAALAICCADMMVALKILSTNFVDKGAGSLLERVEQTEDIEEDEDVEEDEDGDNSVIPEPTIKKTLTPNDDAASNPELKIVATTSKTPTKPVPSSAETQEVLQPRTERTVEAHKRACESLMKRMEAMSAEYREFQASGKMLDEKAKQLATQLSSDASNSPAEPNRKRHRPDSD